MAENNKQQSISSGEKERQDNNDSNLQGRVDKTGSSQFKEEAEQADISHVDRQEGTMNNGTLGGNFGEDETNE